MKRYCPNCQFHWAWKLSDGRFKCRQCGNRYTFRSVWQASRLSDQSKRELLRAFCEEHPASYSMGSLSAPDRFLQSIRLTIARNEHYDYPLQSILAVSADASTRSEETVETVNGHIILGIHRNGETIRVAPVLGPDGQRLASLIQTSVASGELYYTTELHAFGMVTVRNDRITGCVPARSVSVRSDAIAVFWNDLCRCLTRHRDAPVAWLHLLLGEASFRFHHQGEFLASVIEKWVKKTPFFELKKEVEESFPSVVE